MTFDLMAETSAVIFKNAKRKFGKNSFVFLISTTNSFPFQFEAQMIEQIWWFCLFNMYVEFNSCQSKFEYLP